MPDVTNDVIFTVSGGGNTGAVILGVEAGSVMRVNIDDTLSVSGEAADAYATGQAIAAKASTADIQQLLNVNGRLAGTGSWAITVNGDNIPAQNDADTESVAEALERLDGDIEELGSVTTTQHTENGLTAQISKYGRVCTVTINSGALSEAVESEDAIMTLPAGYRPYSDMPVADGTGSFTVCFNSDGTVEASQDLAASYSLRVCVMFITST